MPDQSAATAPSAQPVARRVWDALRMPRRGQVVVGVLLVLLGFGAVTTVRANVDDTTYSGYRQSDLIDLLSGLSATSQRAQDEITRLTRARQQLESATSQREAALAQAKQQLDTLQVLAGTVPVTGPGITATITEVTGRVSVDDMLDLVEELRSNGAEALDINGQRIVAQTSLDETSAGIRISGRTVSAPYVVTAIGEPGTLAAALTFTRGPQDELADDGAHLEITRSQSLDITSTVGTSSTAGTDAGSSAGGAGQ